MKLRLLATAATLAIGLTAVSASAAVTLTTQDGNAVYAGPTPTFDFDTPGTTPGTTGGLVKTGSSANGAQPLGSTGNYFTVGPSTGSPGTIDLSSYGGAIGKISFIWGSVDTYNTLEILDTVGNILATFTGSQIIASQFGNQTLPQSNPLVTFTFSGGDEFNVGGLRLRSTSEAFEIDNIAIQAVPEPGTWLMMIVGFGLLGGMLRSRRRSLTTDTKVSYAF